MIVETIVDVFLNMLRNIMAGFEFIGLPTQTIGALSTILVYGNWVVGVDILALFAASVVFWWYFKMSIGLIVWVWENLL